MRIFHKKTPVLQSLFNKVAGLKAPTQLFCCEICVIFKNTYFEDYLRTSASVNILLIISWSKSSQTRCHKFCGNWVETKYSVLKNPKDKSHPWHFWCTRDYIYFQKSSPNMVHNMFPLCKTVQFSFTFKWHHELDNNVGIYFVIFKYVSI